MKSFVFGYWRGKIVCGDSQAHGKLNRKYATAQRFMGNTGRAGDPIVVESGVLLTSPLLCVLHQQAHGRGDILTSPITMYEKAPTLIRFIVEPRT
jgi:hypothetical protein